MTKVHSSILKLAVECAEHSRVTSQGRGRTDIRHLLHLPTRLDLGLATFSVKERWAIGTNDSAGTEIQKKRIVTRPPALGDAPPHGDVQSSSHQLVASTLL